MEKKEGSSGVDECSGSSSTAAYGAASSLEALRMTKPSVCILGIGIMGAAMTRRLRETGHQLVLWNRSHEKAEAVCGEPGATSCSSASSAAAALKRCGEYSVVLLVLTDTAAVLSLLRADGVADGLAGKILVNLTSGNPDEGREIASVVREVTGAFSVEAFFDGAYCGNPSKARSGAGQLFLSVAPTTGESTVEQARSVLSNIGSVTLCGDIGASRAMDYAVVDLFFVNLLSFMTNAAALEKEGVDVKQFAAEAAKRLTTVPGALELYHSRMQSRVESDYDANPTVTLRTSRSYWASRLPYNLRHGIPSELPNLFVQLLDAASGGEDGSRQDADLSRLQEVVRYGARPTQDSGQVGEPVPKKMKSEL